MFTVRPGLRPGTKGWAVAFCGAMGAGTYAVIVHPASSVAKSNMLNGSIEYVKIMHAERRRLKSKTGMGRWFGSGLRGQQNGCLAHRAVVDVGLA